MKMSGQEGASPESHVVPAETAGLKPCDVLHNEASWCRIWKLAHVRLVLILTCWWLPYIQTLHIAGKAYHRFAP